MIFVKLSFRDVNITGCYLVLGRYCPCQIQRDEALVLKLLDNDFLDRVYVDLNVLIHRPNLSICQSGFGVWYVFFCSFLWERSGMLEVSMLFQPVGFSCLPLVIKDSV